jgi:hypothetical protein
LPDGLQDFQHESRVDLLNWQPSENWPDVFPGLVPLLQVAVASPAWPMGRDISLGTLIEGHRFRRFKLPCSSSRLASLDRINSVVMKLPGGRRPFPGLHQGYVIQRSESHSALAAVPLEPINPGATDRAGLWIKSNLQIQAAPIWIAAGSGGLQLEGRKSMQRQYRDPTVVFPGVFPGDGLIIPHDFGWNATKI